MTGGSIGSAGNPTAIDYVDKIGLSKVGSATGLPAQHVLVVDANQELASESALAKVRGGIGADATNIIFPASGTLVTEAGAQTLSNKTIGAVTAENGLLSISGVGALKIPAGTQAERPASPVEGMMRYNSETDSFEGYASNTWSGIGGGGTVDRIAQVGHSFVLGDVLYLNGSTYVKASAAADNTAEVVGLVSRIIDADNFEMTLSGEVAGLSGLTPGAVYFLSATTAGALTTTEPSVVGQVSLPVGVASSATSLYVAPKRGVVVGAANLRTQIGLDGDALLVRTTNIQKVTGYDAGELAGWVDLNATADYKFYVQAQFVKNAAGAWNISYQTTGDTPPAGFNMDIVTSGPDAFIQVSLPAMAGYVNGKINFALNAPAVGTSLPLQVDSTSVNFTDIKAASAAGITFKEDGGTEVGSVSDSGAWTLGPAVESGVNGVATTIRTGDQGIGIEYSPTKHGTIQIGNGSSFTAVPNIIGITNDDTVGLILSAGTTNANTVYDMGFSVRQNDDDDFTTLTTDAFRFLRRSATLGACTRAGGWTLGNSVFSGSHRVTRSWPSGTVRLLEFQAGVSVRGGIDWNGTALTLATGSDERLKDNIRDLENVGLDKINEIKVRRYEMKESNVSGVGFIAQELEKVLPEAVSNAGEYLAVSYNEMTPYLVKAIQEQQAMIEELKAEIAALKAK